ncbi:hypothetical protein NDU88_003733 [Pleurodeles waltl]|uniref:Uncharacterized protein n=1 Tax=Pleurodeles waltl TaxID=8319 RepID=A0AAV7WPW4_PLEWA|nr:hypothetical protein NDU88_003733 [Pleurodeles waltl]
MEESRAALEEDLMMEEIKQDMRGLQLGKAMGHSGLPIELYKGMANKVAPHLLAMVQMTLQEGVLLDDLCMATIIVIDKAGNPQARCNSYKLISLLNVEIKLRTKAFVNRLRALITSLINQASCLRGE